MSKLVSIVIKTCPLWLYIQVTPSNLIKTLLNSTDAITKINSNPKTLIRSYKIHSKPYQIAPRPVHHSLPLAALEWPAVRAPWYPRGALLAVCLSVSIDLCIFIYAYISLSIHLSIYPSSYPSIHVCTYPSIGLSCNIFRYLSITIDIQVSLLVYTHLYLSISFDIYLHLSKSIYM